MEMGGGGGCWWWVLGSRCGGRAKWMVALSRPLKPKGKVRRAWPIGAWCAPPRPPASAPLASRPFLHPPPTTQPPELH